MKKSLKNILAAGAITLATAMPMQQAEAANEYLKYPQLIEELPPLNPNLIYTLPGDIKVHTRINLKQKGGYGKTNFTKAITPGIRLRAELSHPNSLLGKLELGASMKLPFLPKNASAEITAIPIFVDKDGNMIDKSEISYSLRLNLPYGIRATSFGKIVRESGEETRWNGKIELEREIGETGFKISYTAILENETYGKPSLKPEHMISIKYNF